MQDCVFIPCIECGTYVFANAGGEMVTTGKCRPCRNGWKKESPGDANPYGVRPGQRWVSLDPRDNGREIEILDVDLGEGRATVLSQGQRKRKVKLTNFTRLKGRGYALRPKHVDDQKHKDHDQKHESDAGVVHESVLVDEANGKRAQDKIDGRVDGDLATSGKPKRDRVA